MKTEKCRNNYRGLCNVEYFSGEESCCRLNESQILNEMSLATTGYKYDRSCHDPGFDLLSWDELLGRK